MLFYTHYVLIYGNISSPGLIKIDEGITVLRKGGGAKAKRVNPSTPRSDQHVTSPCDVHMFSSKQLMRILKLIRKKF